MILATSSIKPLLTMARPEVLSRAIFHFAHRTQANSPKNKRYETHVIHIQFHFRCRRPRTETEIMEWNIACCTHGFVNAMWNAHEWECDSATWRAGDSDRATRLRQFLYGARIWREIHENNVRRNRCLGHNLVVSIESGKIDYLANVLKRTDVTSFQSSLYGIARCPTTSETRCVDTKALLLAKRNCWNGRASIAQTSLPRSGCYGPIQMESTSNEWASSPAPRRQHST